MLVEGSEVTVSGCHERQQIKTCRRGFEKAFPSSDRRNLEERKMYLLKVVQDRETRTINLLNGKEVGSES